ncbi:hypothetical protein L1887_39260 [Cichorium endivia]|nr:hypothetical protein L1887_39260 [Cichorium endivia]
MTQFGIIDPQTLRGRYLKKRLPCNNKGLKVLEEYSSFSVKEVGRSVSTAVSVENGGSAEAKAAAYWMTLTPNVEDYNGSVVRMITVGLQPKFW